MGADPTVHVRLLRRADVPRLVDLKVAGFWEVAHADPRLKPAADIRERLPHLVSSWLDQEQRVVLVAEDPDAPDGEKPIVGFATGLLSVWPPIWRAQRVGEVGEAYVVPDRRGRGIGRMLMRGLLDTLVAHGAEVLRASVPAGDRYTLDLLRRMGFDAVLEVAEREFTEP